MTRSARVMCLAAWVGVAAASFGEELRVSRVAIESAPTEGCALARFGIRWQGSWRKSWELPGGGVSTNWDAAWVFLKRLDEDGRWRHVRIEPRGHQSPEDGVVAPAPDGAGLFVYRATSGEGDVRFRDVGVCWSPARNGIETTNGVVFRAIGVEMVYVPAGAFTVGSGGTENGCLYRYTTPTVPYCLRPPVFVADESPIRMAAEPGCVQRGESSTGHGDYAGSRTGLIPEPFPKGTRAFYCMKYELGQGDYVAFLNMLTQNQATNRYQNYNKGWSHTLSGQYPAFKCDIYNRACNFLSWADGAAWADWAGLRPMTELEFEKACRGVAPPVPNEYAWGNTRICDWLYAITNWATVYAVVSNPATNPVGNAGHHVTAGWSFGPQRQGLYAASLPGGTRAEIGATYYGILDMSGNLAEPAVSVGHASGRSFRGGHGDGELTADGFADVADWPGRDGRGMGYRGGYMHVRPPMLRVSDRAFAAYNTSERFWAWGWRSVRTADAEGGP